MKTDDVFVEENLDFFKGWDHSELAQRWGIETDECELLADYIWEHTGYSHEDGDILDADVKQDMLDFLDKLYEDTGKHCYGQGIWAALIDLSDEDDMTFAQFFITLLPHMWT